MEDLHWMKSVGVENNGDFISIQAYSGYDSFMSDPTAEEFILIADASNEELGKAFFAALAQSRSLSYEEACALEKSLDRYYSGWVQRMMARFGYKTKADLFANMKSCHIECFNDIIHIRPSHHVKLDEWTTTNTREDDNVRIPLDSSPTEVGAALRLAFSRCTE